MEKRVWVKILGRHPHSGETGYVLSQGNKVKYRMYGGRTEKFYDVNLVSCNHGVLRCEVGQYEMRIIDSLEADRPRGRSTGRGRRS